MARRHKAPFTPTEKALPLPGPALHVEDRFVAIARELERATLDGLKQYWRRHLGRSAPTRLGRGLFLRLLVYRLQAEAFGDLDPKAARLLDGIARGGRHAESDFRRTGISAGTTLVREHDGVEHRVLVTEGGYAWNDRHFPSLSGVAFAITGTKWNGRRFFGVGQADA